MKRTSLLVVLVFGLVTLGGDCEGDLVQDPTFRDWCGSSLCAWHLDAGRVEHPRNQMRFRAMRFTALHRSSRGIKVPQRRVLQPRVTSIVGKNLFEYQLGFSVRIDGRFAMIFRDGNDLGFAVRRRGRRKSRCRG